MGLTMAQCSERKEVGDSVASEETNEASKHAACLPAYRCLIGFPFCLPLCLLQGERKAALLSAVLLLSHAIDLVQLELTAC